MMTIATYTEDDIRAAAAQTPGVLMRLQDPCWVIRVDGQLHENGNGAELHVTDDEEGQEDLAEEIAEIRKADDDRIQWFHEHAHLLEGREDDLEVEACEIEAVQLQIPCWVVACAECGELFGGESGYHLQPETADRTLTSYGWRQQGGRWVCGDHFAPVFGWMPAPVPAPRVQVERDPRRYLRRKGLARLLVLLGALVAFAPAVNLALQGEPRAAAAAAWFGLIAQAIWTRFVYLPRFKRGTRRWLR